jgi:hypothetical protein
MTFRNHKGTLTTYDETDLIKYCFCVIFIFELLLGNIYNLV